MVFHKSSQGPVRVSFGNEGSLLPVAIARSSATSDDAPVAPKSLFEAAERGTVGYIVRQVERNIEYNINQRDKFQRTALHWAAECNQVEAAEALLDYGCDVTACECNGRTAVHLAAREGHAGMLQALLQDCDAAKREVLCNQRDMFGITPVFLSLQRGEESRAAFEFIMQCGGKYNSQPAAKFKPDPPATGHTPSPIALLPAQPDEPPAPLTPGTHT
ncbi:ankyrin repeat-containing domain protein [Haematococcus lacustris]